MRRNAISTAVQEEESEINITPMLDVVFIMLIFFIVTALMVIPSLIFLYMIKDKLKLND